MTRDSPTSDKDVSAFIHRWSESGGGEMSNHQMFIVELCGLLGLPHPDPSREENQYNDYVFERGVVFKHPNGTQSHGRIDLYRRNAFVLEAKQSGKRKAKKVDPSQIDLIPEDARQVRAGSARRGSRNWDAVMVAARKQAEDYARALPVEHGYPPFLLVLDVGHVLEIHADFSGQGKNYAQFPDRRSYRITLEDLADPKVRDLLVTIWTDPFSLDPVRKSAEVTRDIAARLAKIARGLESRHDPREVAEFLMRCLFTMFAEDVELLPEKGFERLLAELKETPKNFVPAMENLWSTMDKGGYAPFLNATLRRFNGTLFKRNKAIALSADEINELWIAARQDWREVEPAIFGTLLERALDKRERSKLGAHYTPRAYVERLVVPTIIEPLRDDWVEVQARIEELRAENRNEEALAAARAFHHQLCTTRILDPACGTGNFLYVSLELMKRLEGEVLDALDDLGEAQGRLAMAGETVDPRQFYGLEINPRAVAIADLVLWIGFLKWQLKTGGPDTVSEPVLDAYGTIREQDAILAFDKQELLRDGNGKPLSRWDGHTMKLHPITGEEIPDPDATVELYSYVDPRPAKWPEAEFVVGNPPFIGGKDMRAELGDGYAEACWAARKHIPGGADFVMHFWDSAADQLRTKGAKLRRFGFITTNSITQAFSRRVIERHMNEKWPLSLVFAVPDHPWLKAADKAAVRIAMTVAERGESSGVIAKVRSESGLNSDTPRVELETWEGRISASLAIGANTNLAKPLLANDSLSSRGVVLHGSGFIVTPAEARALGLGTVEGLEEYILEYRNGRDLANRPRGVMVIDLFTLTSDEVRERFPSVYQHILQRVKPERDSNKRDYRRLNWWLFGENIPVARTYLFSIPRYIATVETSRHRFFQFLDKSIRPDNKLLCIGSADAALLACLCSRVHVVWSMAAGGRLGVGNDPVYVKTRVFDPFPFPVPAFEDYSKSIDERLRDLGERLDSFRKERLAAHDFLTMTGLYNVLERGRELANGCDVTPLTDKEREIHEAGLISVLAELHDEIDRAVLAAYGWDDLAGDLIGKPGATLPSPHKSSDQEAAEQELLTRLVELNRERVAEERRGTVHWLRPDFQIPKLGAKVTAPEQQIEADVSVLDVEEKPKWPSDGLDQIRIVRDVLEKATEPAGSDAISSVFAGRNTQKRKDRVSDVLETLAATGAARAGIEPSDNSVRYFVPR